MAEQSEVLYKRYTDIKEILLAPDGVHETSEPAPSTQPDAQHDAGQPVPSPNVGVSTDGAKAMQRGNAPDSRKISGPSNASEAMRIRERLGIRSSAPASTTAQQEFSFGFAAVDSQPDGPEAEPSPNNQEVPAEQVDAALQERLKRVRGEPSGSTDRRVFVGGMPFSYEEADVEEYWSYCGEIESLDLMRFPDTGRFKGIAFITFKTEEGYKAALECHGMMLQQTQLKVEPCKSAGPKTKKSRHATSHMNGGKQQSGSAPKVLGYNVAYVGNIAFEADVNDLRELMSDCSITKVRMHTDKDTGKFKGYAHVHFADEESLDRALQYDGAMLKDRSLKVGYAQPKKQTDRKDGGQEE